MRQGDAVVVDAMTQRRQRRRRYMTWSLVLLVSLTLILPLIPYAVEYAQVNDSSLVPNPGADLWRDVRQRDNPVLGQTQDRGVDAGILINKSGEDWRIFRMQWLAPYGAIFMGTVLGLTILFYMVRGRVPIPGGRSGKLILRFTLNQRMVHWFTVGIFLLLALTGFILLYGRFILIPILGPEGFSITASACKEAHNLFGPLFLFAMLLLFITFVKDNFYERGDLGWMITGGGLVGEDTDAGRFNAAQKAWFWIATIFGLALCITGLILDFAVIGQSREIMAISHVIHGTSAVVMTGVLFGHIYWATAGMEGGMESMTTGYVDENWAKSHHNRWYEEVKNAGEIEKPSEQPGPGGASATGLAKPRTGD